MEEFSDEEDEPLYTNCRDAVKVHFISNIYIYIYFDQTFINVSEHKPDQFGF